MLFKKKFIFIQIKFLCIKALPLLFIILFINTKNTSAKEWVSLNASTETKPVVNLIGSNESETTLELNINGFFRTLVNTGTEQAFIISLSNASPIIKKGTPDICKISQSIIIADENATNISIVESAFIDIQNISVAPSKGLLTRNEDPASKAYNYNSVYEVNSFYPGHLADLNDPYILRDFRGQTVNFYPFQYNPVTKTLRVYTKLVVKVTSVNNERSVNELKRNTTVNTINSEYANIYKGHFINNQRFQYTPTNEDGKLLIISHGPFINAMMPFVDWKNERGLETEIIDVATIGNNEAAIRAYISNYYSNNNLSFVLLVGDNVEVAPPMNLGAAEDPTYGHILGNDSYAEVFIGRFSAQTIAHVETQVQRVINYEKYAQTTDTWYEKGVVVASDQGPGDDGEKDFEHARNMRTDLLNNTFSHVDELYDGSQGGSDAPGNPSPTMLLNAINDGRSVFTYTGHGTSINCSTTGLSVTHVNSMTNVGKLPMIFSVACVNGNFVNTTCFAETFLRAEHNGQPAGAIATMMSSVNQSWAPPMDAQDEMIDILTDSYQNNIKRTFGGITVNGCMHMNDEYGAAGYPMTNTWHIFGDPSLMVRTGAPTLITANYPQTILIGTSSLTVPCSSNDALVSLTINSEIVSKAPVIGGFAALTFPALQTLDTMVITITGFNKVSLQDEIIIIPASGPYVIHIQNSATEIVGNNDGDFDFDEELFLNVLLQNMGVANAHQLQATLSCTDPFITINQSNSTYNDLNAGAFASQNSAFRIKIADDVPDNHLVTFDITVVDANNNSWTSSFSRIVRAPNLSFNTISVDDGAGGNGNGIAEPGETVVLLLEIKNNGHSISPFATASLSSTNQNIIINNSSSLLGAINNGNKAVAAFNVTLNSNLAFGTPIEFDALVSAGNYGDQITFYRSAGIPFEDFETGDFNKFSWNTGGHSPWFASLSLPFEGDHCAESGNISDNQKSEFSITVNVLDFDSISFARKTSSELHWDYLRFYIDGAKQAEWSGLMGWGIESFNVSPGVHNFKWVYEKDAVVSAYEDKAWIDNIFLPAFTSLNTGIEQEELLTSINVYPNPSTDFVITNFALENKEYLSIKVLDLSGKVVQIALANELRNPGQHEEIINVQNLATGTYLLIFELSNQTIIHKLLVTK